MAKHTPGPWEIKDDQIVTVDAGILICDLPLEDEVEWGAPDLIAEVEANARLIASAPNLLTALERLTRIAERANRRQHAGVSVTPEDWSEMFQACGEANAAIAKARANQAEV